MFLALTSIGVLALSTGGAWMLGSFGASCVLLFGFPDVPFSRPRNVIGGHLLSSAVGLLFLYLLGPHWWAMAVAGACAVMLMMATDTVHPPAGSNPVIIFLLQPGWDFLILPTLAGACVLVLISRVYRAVQTRLKPH
uniref:HPP family protein n=1 Tax=Verminephrobacter eiseniae TaxID=364317 RepID=UPI0022375BCD|nr:HPP family protein [Verminephrobacter eiseniae]